MSRRTLIDSWLMADAAKQRGFTLIELIIVIVVLAIMSFGTTQFIVNSSQSYMDTAVREREGSAARMVVEKITRELRGALPNSVRVIDLDGSLSGDNQGDCLEFVPALGGSIYTSLPRLGSAASFSSVPFEVGGAPPVSSSLGSISRAAVYPINTADIYALSASSAISSEIDTGSVLEGSTEVTVLLQASHQFPLDSPSKRWFMVTAPVSFCIGADGQLFRYGDYGFIDTPQPTPGGFGGGSEQVPKRSLLAKGASGGFVMVPATLQRNALVQLNLDIRDRGEGVTISHEVQMRNVP
ncbi:MAG: type II secretion system protein [Motiliproteus sp.]